MRGGDQDRPENACGNVPPEAQAIGRRATSAALLIKARLPPPIRSSGLPHGLCAGRARPIRHRQAPLRMLGAEEKSRGCRTSADKAAPDTSTETDQWHPTWARACFPDCPITRRPRPEYVRKRSANYDSTVDIHDTNSLPLKIMHRNNPRSRRANHDGSHCGTRLRSIQSAKKSATPWGCAEVPPKEEVLEETSDWHPTWLDYAPAFCLVASTFCCYAKNQISNRENPDSRGDGKQQADSRGLNSPAAATQAAAC